MRTLAAVSFFCIFACALALNYYDYSPSIVAASSPLTYAINEPVSYVRRYAAPAVSYVAQPAPITTTYVQKAAAPIAYTYGNPYSYGYGGYGYPYGYYKK